MKFTERSFVGSHYSLPRPEIFFEPKERFLLIATPWGPRASSHKAIQTIADYYLSSKSDQEITSPFERLTNLSTTANNLRIAALLGNEMILEQENKNEYRFGFELFLASFNQTELVWVQAGHPHVCLSRKGQAILPLSLSLDLSAELSATRSLAPLPSNLIGLDSNPNMYINSFRPQPGDQFILISRSWLPEQLFSLPYERRDLETLSRCFATNQDDPFWVGVWDL